MPKKHIYRALGALAIFLIGAFLIPGDNAKLGFFAVVILLAPLVALPTALKVAKGGFPVQHVVRDANGYAVGMRTSVAPKKKLWQVAEGKWYLLLQLGGLGAAIGLLSAIIK